jgi:L-fucose mutarotase/ribose pyranase (RbsD/FucU family)
VLALGAGAAEAATVLKWGEVRAAGRPVRLPALERFAFYERARQAFAVLRTGEARPYGNILLTKGVVRPEGP